MTGSSAPSPPTVGKELGSATTALSGGSGGTILFQNGTLGANLAGQNTEMNVQNVQALSNAYFGNQLPNAQTTATSLGNAFLTNQVGNVGGNLGTLSSDLNSANPYASSLLSSATGKNFLGAGVNPTLTNIENIQANQGASINPTMSSLSAQMGLSGNSVGALTGAQDLLSSANTQLSFGSSLSPTMTDQISQASRSADSSRGIFDSNTSAFDEMLAQGTYGQNLLQQREQFAQGANSIAQGATGLNQAAFTGASNITAQGLASQLGFLQGASQTQNNALQQQFLRQNSGLSELGSLTGLGAQNASMGLDFIRSQSGAYGAGLGASLFGQGMNTMMSSQANPTSPLWSSLGLFNAAVQNANTAYNGSFAAQEQNAQASNSLLGAGIGSATALTGAIGSAGGSSSLFASLGAGIMGGLSALCWVAREVFGDDNPQWLEFREFLTSEADEEFREFYLTHGPEIAETIKAQPQIKILIRSLMTEIISRRNNYAI